MMCPQCALAADALGALDQLGALVGRLREAELDELDAAVGVRDLLLDDAALERDRVGVAVLERGVERDQREAGEQAQDDVARAVRARVLEDVLDLRDVLAVAPLLLLVHVDRDGLDHGLREARG